jgi:tRNA threonylcarbamoyladenosine biosynthesis protein TsaE
MQTWTYDSESLDATGRLGAALSERLVPGAVVALVGPLGAGKTQLVQVVAEALGADRRLVTSPTFVLVHEYAARLPVYHFDAYRLSDPVEFAELGVEEYFAGKGVCLVEWADKVRGCLPEEYLEVRISVTGPSSRRFEFAAYGTVYERILDAMAQSDDADR